MGLTMRTASSKRDKALPQDDEAWREAPILVGHTKFDPLHDVQNILVTGGEGFM